MPSRSKTTTSDPQATLALKFDYQIRRSDNNVILAVPNLSAQNLILSQIDFQADYWHFEACLRSNAQDLVRLTATYFQHRQQLDLSKLAGKLEEGDKLELHVKPKAAPKNINLSVIYHYTSSDGAIVYQNNVRLTELKDSNCLSDLSQFRPTQLMIKAQHPILTVSLEPKFSVLVGELTFPSYQAQPSDGDDFTRVVLDFNDSKLAPLVPLLKHYDLSVKVDIEESKEMDAQLYLLGYGFK